MVFKYVTGLEKVCNEFKSCAPARNGPYIGRGRLPSQTTSLSKLWSPGYGLFPHLLLQNLSKGDVGAHQWAKHMLSH